MIYNEAVAHVVRGIDLGLYGGTYSTHGASVPTDGFWVGGVGETIRVEPDHDREHLAYLVQSVIVSTQAEWIGYWMEAETSLYHLDGCSWTDDVDLAAKWAKDRGELAFHSIRSGTDLWV
jgi:hypothetical protein